MTKIRFAISAFMALLLIVLIRGWIWTASHQTASQAAASHVVLTLGMVAGLLGLYALWRRPARPPH